MKTIEDLVAAIEARYPCVDGIYHARCQTGDEYVIIGDPKRDAKADVPLYADKNPPPGTCPYGAQELSPDLETALWRALACFNLYADWWHREHPGENPKLYWRYDAPRAFLQEHTKRGRRGAKTYRCYIRMRLALSAKPVLAEQPEIAGAFPPVPDAETWDDQKP
jgi:hypothetical protein